MIACPNGAASSRSADSSCIVRYSFPWILMRAAPLAVATVLQTRNIHGRTGGFKTGEGSSRPALLLGESAGRAKHRKPDDRIPGGKKASRPVGRKRRPFPRGVEERVQNTRRFLELCNQVKYPVYITTKNTAELPVDLLAEGNYVLAVSLASHRAGKIKLLERNTSTPQERINGSRAGHSRR